MTKLEKIIYDAIASGYSKEITEFTKEQITKDSERIAAAVLPLIEKAYDSGVLTGQVSEAHPKADKNFINDEKGQWLSENITKETE
jgi:hypothetical protein